MDEQHTKREYELEEQLFQVLANIQNFIVSTAMNDHDGMERDYKRLRELVQHWRENFGEYMQHPDWDKPMNDEVTASS